jgi:hypothetical protein
MGLVSVEDESINTLFFFTSLHLNMRARIIRENKTTPELCLRKRFLELIKNMTKICGYSKEIIINEPRRESYGTPDVK